MPVYCFQEEGWGVMAERVIGKFTRSLVHPLVRPFASLQDNFHSLREDALMYISLIMFYCTQSPHVMKI